MNRSPLPAHEVKKTISDLRAALDELEESYPSARSWRYGKDSNSSVSQIPTGPTEISDPTGNTAVRKEWASDRLVRCTDNLEDAFESIDKAVYALRDVVGDPSHGYRRRRRRRKGPRRCESCGNVLPKPQGPGRPPDQCPSCRDTAEPIEEEHHG